MNICPKNNSEKCHEMAKGHTDRVVVAVDGSAVNEPEPPISTSCYSVGWSDFEKKNTIGPLLCQIV